MATFTGQVGVAADYLQPGLAPVPTVVVVVPVVTSGIRTGGMIVRTQSVVVG